LNVGTQFFITYKVIFMNLFLDTNIYLNFYHYSDDEIDELKKILVLIEAWKLKLFVTDQLINEFNRNREAKIQDALKIFLEWKFKNFPNLIKGEVDYDNLVRAKKDYDKYKKNIQKNIKSRILEYSLDVDKIISELFDISKKYTMNEDILMKAKNRYDVWNPPGKGNSYWDAISRELLLSKFPEWEELIFVSNDKDYRSIIDNNKINPFLVQERGKQKETDLIFYPSLWWFFKDKFPNIKLSTDLQRETRIDSFINSLSFSSTRRNLHKLKVIFPIQEGEYIKIIDGMLDNNQIYRVGQDEDIKLLFHQIIDQFFDTLEYSKQIEVIKKFWYSWEAWLPF